MKLIFAAIISYYFGLIILKYHLQAGTLLALAVFVILFLTRIEYAFYFYLASRTTVEIFYTVGPTESFKITHFSGVLLSILFVYYIIVISRFNPRYNFFTLLNLNVNKIFGSFLIISIPSVFFTESFIFGFGYWLRLFQGFLILNITIILILSAETESYKKRIKAICWSVIIALFYPYYLFLKNIIQGETVWGSGGIYRFTGFGGQSNFFSYVLFMVFSFVLFLYSISVRNLKKIYWIFLLVIVASIGFSYTRNIWVGLVVLIIVWSILKKRFAITFIIIGIITMLIVFIPIVQERLVDVVKLALTSTEGFFSLDPKIGGFRMAAWQTYIRYFLDESTLIEKFFGNGFDIHFKLKVYAYFLAEMWEHNNYIALLMNTGICGLTVYLLYIFSLFKEGFELLRRTKEDYLRNLAQVFISLLCAYVIIGINTHLIFFLTFQYYFSAFAGLVVAANILEKERERGMEELSPNLENK